MATAVKLAARKRRGIHVLARSRPERAGHRRDDARGGGARPTRSIEQARDPGRRAACPGHQEKIRAGQAGRRIIEEATDMRAAAIVMPLPRRVAGGSLFGKTLETVLTERPCRVIIESRARRRRLYVITYSRMAAAVEPLPAHRAAGAGAARGDGPLAARPRRALRRLRADALARSSAARRARRCRSPRASPPGSSCGCPAAAARRGRRGHDRARRRAPPRRRRRPPLRDPHARRCPACAPSSPATRSRRARRTGGPGDPPMHEPGSRETAVVESGDA